MLIFKICYNEYLVERTQMFRYRCFRDRCLRVTDINNGEFQGQSEDFFACRGIRQVLKFIHLYRPALTG